MGNAKQFIEHLQDNAELCDSLDRDGWDSQAVVDAGAAAGYSFDAEEYRGAYRELASHELAAVSGGQAITAALATSSGLAATIGAAASWKPPVELLDLAVLQSIR